MSKKLKMPSTDLFNKEFESLAEERMNEIAKTLREGNKEYKLKIDEVEYLRKELEEELNEIQVRKLNLIIDTLNYISSIEITSAYKTGINDFNNLKLS